MKAIFFIILFLSQLCYSQSWLQLADFPGTARDDGASFKINDKVYCGIGLEVGWTCPNDFYIFDLSTESWTTAAGFPSTTTRQYACGFPLNGKGYVFGGVDCSNSFLNDLWEFDPSTNNWTQKTSMPSIGRSGSVSFIINDTAYVLGGKTSTINALPELWAYEPISDVWMQKPDMPINGTWRGVAFSYKGTGIVGLGKNALEQFNKEFYAYSSNKNNWTQIAGYQHSGRVYTGYAQKDSIAYLFGGIDTLDVIDSTFEQLDLSNFNTYGLAFFPSIHRKGCMSFTGNNSFYITTGVSNTTRLKETWRYYDAVGLKEQEANTSVSIYPNPTTRSFTITNKREPISNIMIYDLLGKVILTLTDQRSNEFLIDRDLIKGIYTLVCETGSGKRSHHKIIIQ